MPPRRWLATSQPEPQAGDRAGRFQAVDLHVIKAGKHFAPLPEATGRDAAVEEGIVPQRAPFHLQRKPQRLPGWALQAEGGADAVVGAQFVGQPAKTGPGAKLPLGLLSEPPQQVHIAGLHLVPGPAAKVAPPLTPLA